MTETTEFPPWDYNLWSEELNVDFWSDDPVEVWHVFVQTAMDRPGLLPVIIKYPNVLRADGYIDTNTRVDGVEISWQELVRLAVPKVDITRA